MPSTLLGDEGVVSVFNHVFIPAAIKLFGDLGPLVLVLPHELEEQSIFTCCPGLLFEFRPEMVEPHLSAVFESLEDGSFGKSEEFKGNGFPFDFAALFVIPCHNRFKIGLFFKAPFFILNELHREEALNFKPESLDGVPDEDSPEEAEVLFALNEVILTS